MDAAVSAHERLERGRLGCGKRSEEVGGEDTYMRMATVATSCGYRERTKLTPRMYHTTPLTEFCEGLACNVMTEEGV